MKINHRQLTFAREYRGYTQTDLSSAIRGLSQPNLSKFEKGLSTMSDELLQKTINYLKFPYSFLYKNISNESDTAHFRKRASISKEQRIKIDHSFKLIGYIIDEMADSIDWPSMTLDALDLEDGYDPEYVASHTRKLFGLKPNEPVRDICSLIERKGIIIVELDEIEKFDGVSFLTDKGTPTIVINKNFSNDRKRFTIAHELGHLLMHSINNPAIPHYRDKESEANEFASEFLMPKNAISNALYDLRLSDLSELKRYWLTSMASIVRRAMSLELIDSNTYKYLNIEVSRNGRMREDSVNVYIDSPEVFRKGYLMHKNELSYSDSELAEAFDLPTDIINRFCDFDDRKRSHTKLKVVI